MYHFLDMKCVKCASERLVKYGFQAENQRFKCKNCSKIFINKKPKYSDEFKLRCIEMYLNNCGIRKVAKLQKVSHVMVIYWIKKMAKFVQSSLAKKTENLQKSDIEILEVDELVTYIKKNLQNGVNTGGNTHLYGFVWNETQAKFLIFK